MLRVFQISHVRGPIGTFSISDSRFGKIAAITLCQNDVLSMQRSTVGFSALKWLQTALETNKATKQNLVLSCLAMICF